MTGITHDSNTTLNITGQAIGSDTGPAPVTRAARQAAASANRNTGVRNTGTGTITITDSYVDGQHTDASKLLTPPAWKDTTAVIDTNPTPA